MTNQYPPYATEKISEHFWVIHQQGVRCFLFEGEDMALLVDAGFGGKLKEECEKLTDKPIHLILTHADGDHTGAAAQFGPVMMHPAEFAYCEMRSGKAVNAIPVWEDDVIDIGTFRFEIILISGHTPGSIALLEREKRFIITGDTVGTEPVYMFNTGRNMPAYLAAVRKLKGMSEDFDVIYASHGKINPPKDILRQLCVLAGEITNGKYPPAKPAPAHMPETVKIYAKGDAAFYCEKK
ncbi:MAG: MBL fold metallo-hydrolase [Oscillospiraceae bacterium]|nr:MBL fold metallo-hydrolase [Oscillospiraceae bacterium]